jgi:adenylate cyclase
MNIEIERKFLVIGDFKSQAVGKFEIKQGYISTDPDRVVRIRIADKKGFITIKGTSDESGMARLEWEKEIDYEEANQLLELCNKPVIEKTRFIIEYEKHIVEVDEFTGENQGLVLAEIELADKEEPVELPEWIGREVTNDFKYYNSYLSTHPYINWSDESKQVKI